MGDCGRRDGGKTYARTFEGRLKLYYTDKKSANKKGGKALCKATGQAEAMWPGLRIGFVTMNMLDGLLFLFPLSFILTLANEIRKLKCL